LKGRENIEEIEKSFTFFGEDNFLDVKLMLFSLQKRKNY